MPETSAVNKSDAASVSKPLGCARAIYIYFATVTTSASVFFPLWSLRDNRFSSIFHGRFSNIAGGQSPIAVAIILLVIAVAFVSTWLSMFISGLFPFIFGMAFVRWRKIESLWFFILVGAVNGIFYCLIFAYFSPIWYTEEGTPQMVEMYRLTKSAPYMLLAGVSGGVMWWRKMCTKDRTIELE